MPLLVKHVFITAIGVSVFLISFQVLILPNIKHETRAIIMRAEFVAVLQSILSLLSYILWKTLKPLPDLLKRQISHRNKSSLALTLPSNEHSEEHSSLLLWKLFLITFIVLCHISYLTNIFLLNAEPNWFCILTYVCLGTLIQFNTGLFMMKGASFTLRLISMYIVKHSNPKGLSQKIIIFSTIFYTLTASTWGFYSAAKLPTISNVSIPMNDLPPSLQNFRIVQLSDIHLGPTVGRTRLQKIVDLVNVQNGDVVVLTGDLVDGTAKKLKEAAHPLSSLRSKHGVMYVSGNHEYYTGDVDNWFTLLQSLGLNVLHNSNMKVPANAVDQICFAGTDDLQADKISYGSHSFNVTKAVSGCDKKQPTILLAHQPKAAKMALDMDIGIDLVLSGHTHGGQIVPMNIVCYFANPFFLGLYEYKGGHVYISSGTQFWGIPMRIGTSMEVTAITLMSS